MMRALLLSAWALFIVVALGLGPSVLPSNLVELSWRLTTFDWPNVSLCCLWYATGVLLFLHATYYFSEAYSPHPLIVLVLSPVFGSLLLLPYYALRRPNPTAPRWRWPWRLLRYVLIAELIGFVCVGAFAGDLVALWADVTQRRFSHFLFVDFITLGALLLSVRKESFRRVRAS